MEKELKDNYTYPVIEDGIDSCPKCNSCDIVYYNHPSNYPTLICQTCGFAIGSRENKAEAIKHWNGWKKFRL
jgi:Zn ribbon nucleic-acid-binding protein